ncbi:hypothetical protein ABZS66_13995 [Dactylosporangium sp. NPDC005572]|uniref:hypothetical protein n=1 Tax=Dactylosporangium sp. NPDC005572 TaxID=3156889 RepID=UPI0033BB4860
MPDMDTSPRLDELLLDALRGPDDQLVRRNVLRFLADLNEHRVESLRPVEDALLALLSRGGSQPAVAEVRDEPPPPPEVVIQEPEPEPEPVVVERPPAERLADELAALWRELAADDVIGPFARQFRAAEESGEPAWDTWARIHLLRLRVATGDADEIRERAVGAVRRLDPGYAPTNEFVPGLPVLGRAGDDLRGTVELSAAAVAGLEDPTRPDRRKLHELVRRFVWLAAHDPSVWVGGASLLAGQDGLQRFETKQAQILQTEIGQRLNDLLEADAGSAAEMRALANVDELLRGVVPLPLPAKGSWWLERLAETYDMLSGHIRNRDYDLAVRPPHLWYSKLVGQRKLDETSLAVPGVPPAEEGKVLWTLRFPRIVDPPETGRVLYGTRA